MLLTDPKGDVLTLALNADNSGNASPVFNDLPGLVPVNLSMDGYNVGRLLWSKTTGDNLLLNILPDNSTSTLTTMTAGHLANTGVTCGYDGDGLRAWKQNDAGQRTYFLYDGSDPICELDGGGNVTAANTFGASGLVSRHLTATNSSAFYTFDESGPLDRRPSAGNFLQTYAAAKNRLRLALNLVNHQFSPCQHPCLRLWSAVAHSKNFPNSGRFTGYTGTGQQFL